MDAASDAEVLAATSQLEALEVSILELEEKKKQVLAFLARKIAAVLVSAGDEAAAEGGADAMDVDPAVTTGAGPSSRITFDKLVGEAKGKYGSWPSGPRPNQEAVLRVVEEGSDRVAILATGAGKTLCYALPAAAVKATSRS
ncbi:hypothetical protein M885DRAFT_578621 [Pelagophyceae sp. CCMP2097]|nr:hypothetical protein M885DRAFT_578621 [Pelagophyceae sp. CCMP2097]